ncbi:MAG: hypothetical protein KGS72_24665 [Cyanobacteria bacterium REEB67]|nr:hypothetical protein [Cyanobacteria bacterium REEB67]
MNQTDRKEFVKAPAEKVSQVLVKVLADFGWQLVSGGDLSITAELLVNDRTKGHNCFTAIITCIPISEGTELLLSICGSGNWSTDFLASWIMTELRKHMSPAV